MKPTPHVVSIARRAPSEVRSDVRSPARSTCVVAALATAALLAAAPAHAGRSCETRKPTAEIIDRGMKLAQQTFVELEDQYKREGHRVVMLGRAGQDLSQYGLRYSHLGWAYRTPEGRWRVAHKLNECGTADGHVYRQGLGEFFLDDLWRHEAVLVIPAPQVQQHLLPVLQDNRRARTLQHRPYSVVSYAWSTKYQQSNQWALETLALAMEPTTVRNRAQAQAWLQFKGYEPTTLHIGPLTRLGARTTRANVAFDDHPNDKRFSDRIETITVDSVMAWMQRTQLGSPPVILAASGG
jgi:hypothetical protein